MWENVFNKTPIDYLALAIKGEVEELLEVRKAKIIIALQGSEIIKTEIITKTSVERDWIENNIKYCPILGIIKAGLIKVIKSCDGEQE